MNKEELIKRLLKNDCKVTFFKIDGTKREILASLSNKPQPVHLEGKPMLAVIDKVLNEFRTINCDTIQEVK